MKEVLFMTVKQKSTITQMRASGMAVKDIKEKKKPASCIFAKCRLFCGVLSNAY